MFLSLHLSLIFNTEVQCKLSPGNSTGVYFGKYTEVGRFFYMLFGTELSSVLSVGQQSRNFYLLV